MSPAGTTPPAAARRLAALPRCPTGAGAPSSARSWSWPAGAGATPRRAAPGPRSERRAGQAPRLPRGLRGRRRSPGLRCYRRVRRDGRSRDRSSPASTARRTSDFIDWHPEGGSGWPRRLGRSQSRRIAREIDRHTAMTAGVRATGSTLADGVSTDSAAITSLPRPKIGAATDVIGDGSGREATATPSRRTAASVARSSDGDSRRSPAPA